MEPGGVSGYEDEGVLLPDPDELLSVMAEAGLRRSVFTSILADDVKVMVGVEAAELAAVQAALVNGDESAVGNRLSLAELAIAGRPFIRLSGDAVGARRFFFTLLLMGGDLEEVRVFKDSVSTRFSPEITKFKLLQIKVEKIARNTD